MDEDELPINVIDRYSEHCELGDGRKCFGPGEAIQKFVNDCQTGKVVMASGEVFKATPGDIPLVLMLNERIYDQLLSVAGSKGLSPKEFMEIYISMLLEDEEILEGLDTDLEKIAEDDNTFGAPATWGDSEMPPPTDDTAPVEGVYGSVSEADNSVVEHKKKIARFGTTSIRRLEDALDKIHDQAEGDISIWMGFHRPEEIELNIEYPEDGVKLESIEEGSFSDAFEAQISRLIKWEALTFGPKLESGTSITANLGAKILEFDKTIGKYKVQLGENLIVEVNPEDIAQVVK